MNARIAIGIILVAFLPAWGWELSKLPDSLTALWGFLGYVLLVGYLIATGYRLQEPKV